MGARPNVSLDKGLFPPGQNFDFNPPCTKIATSTKWYLFSIGISMDFTIKGKSVLVSSTNVGLKIGLKRRFTQWVY